jgi:cyclophilin family peptidyl-prolyl cis-trans isomerase
LQGFFVVAAASIGLNVATIAQGTIVRFTTSVGVIDVRLYNTLTPNSVTNFMNYVTANKYDNTFFHRVPQFKGANGSNLGTQHFVVQGGGFLLNNSIWSAAGIVTNAPIGDEFHISNTRGTIAFAKNSQGATSQWFFNVGNNSFLDAQNFTVFGRVLGDGMDVVDEIDNLPAINAAVAQNVAGEDFDEIPVRNPLTRLDITSNEAVMVTNIEVLNLPAGDYDFNGVVNAADQVVWQSSFGSTTNAAADGNGDGRVDVSDYIIWRKGMSGGGGSSPGLGVPEPSCLAFLLCGLAAAAGRRFRRALKF